MRLAIMQPYFFPYLGYFELIAAVDQWIVFDTAQYSKHGWTNRNRILHPRSGWQYIGAPIHKTPLRTAIRDIRVCDDADWRGKLLRQTEHYRRRAPYYEQTRDLLERALACMSSSLARINVHALETCCQHLGISFPCQWHSIVISDNLVSARPTAPAAADEPLPAALQIAMELGADTYVNSPGGAELYSHRQFADAGLQLLILPSCDFTYDTTPYEFHPRLSILDVLMWNPVERVQEHLAAPQSSIGE